MNIYIYIFVTFLVIILNIALVYTYSIAPYPVKKVNNESLWGPESKIFAGTEAEDNQFPFMILLLIKTGKETLRCSASLIDPLWVLTAAHCFEIENVVPKRVFLVGGKENLQTYLRIRSILPLYKSVNEEALGVQERRAAAIFSHPKYNKDTSFYDVALVQLNTPFTSPNITVIPISREKMEKPMTCTVLGWGLTEKNPSNSKLNYVSNIYVETSEMGCKYITVGPLICIASERGPVCKGDSGSPLVCDNKAWGVASFYLNSLGKTCANAEEDYYTYLYPNLEWINAQMSGEYVNAESPSTVVSAKNMLILIAFWLFFEKLIKYL